MVIAAAIYGNQWSGKCVQFKVDNLTVYSSGSSGHLQPRTPLNVPCLITGVIVAHFNFWFSASHIAGTDKSLADSFSCNNTQLFLSQVPQAMRHPSRIPPPLIKLLEWNLTWSTTAWAMLLCSSFSPLDPFNL